MTTTMAPEYKRGDGAGAVGGRREGEGARVG
jgi:hypothetical protein